MLNTVPPWVLVSIIILGGGLLYIGALGLIDAYFKRKEQFTQKLHDQIKGTVDAKRE